MNTADQNEFSFELCDGILDHMPVPILETIPCQTIIKGRNISVFNDNVKTMIQCYIDAQNRLNELSALVIAAEAECRKSSHAFNETNDVAIINDMIQRNFARRQFEKEQIAQLELTLKIHKYLRKVGIKFIHA